MKRIPWRLLPRYLFLCAVSVMMFIPFYWMLVTAFKTTAEMSVYPPTLLPQSLQLENFSYVLEHSYIGVYFCNSLITATVETVIVLFISVLTAFGLYRYPFRGRGVLFVVLLLLHALPFEVIMIFLYRMMLSWGLYDTLIALILPFLCNFMYVYILYNTFCTIPQQVVLAAGIDGASQLKFLWRIALPHARPSLVFIAIMNAVGCWNSFIWPMMITSSIASRTLPFGVYTYMTEIGSRNELIMAMSLLFQLPIILIFFLLRQQLINVYR